MEQDRRSARRAAPALLSSVKPTYTLTISFTDNLTTMALPKTKQPPPRIQIQAVEPLVDCGRYPVKRTVGDRVDVFATVFKDGHDVLAGAVRVRGPGQRAWREEPLRALESDRWAGSFEVDRPGRWQFAVSAWTDRLATWQDELRRKVDAGQEDLAGELSEGAALLGRESLTVEEGLAAESGERDGEVITAVLEVDVDRVLARFGAWYELFPRSWGGFKGVTAVLPRLAELGFDVVYLPPIHPIGTTNRKGRNNALVACRGRPRVALGHRRAGGRPRRDQPGARHVGGLRRDGPCGCEDGCRDRARLRDPVLAGPPVAEGPSRVVQPPAGRDPQVRREPTEALPGHLQRQLRVGGLARALAGAPRGRPRAGSTAASRFSVWTTRTRSRPRSGNG